MSFASRLQRFFRRPPKAVAAPDIDMTLGGILLRMQAVTPAQLTAALRERSSMEDTLLGEWLSARRVCRPEAVRAALSIQKKFRDGDTSGALLELLETRLKILAEGERRITEAIDSAQEECLRSGHARNLWLTPSTSHAAE